MWPFTRHKHDWPKTPFQAETYSATKRAIDRLSGKEHLSTDVGLTLVTWQCATCGEFKQKTLKGAVNVPGLYFAGPAGTLEPYKPDRDYVNKYKTDQEEPGPG